LKKQSAYPFGPPLYIYIYIGVKGGGLWAKHMGFKARCYWEHLMGTHWEVRGT